MVKHPLGLALAAGLLFLPARALAAGVGVQAIPLAGVLDTPRDFVAHGGAAFFTAHGAQDDLVLWTTDGTSAGTRSLATVSHGASGTYGTPYLYASLSTPHGLLLVAPDLDTGKEALWRSDGTASGTVRVADLPRDAAHTYVTSISYSIVNAGAKTLLLRQTYDGSKAWVSVLSTDGTAAGTVDTGVSAISTDVHTLGANAFFVGTDGNVKRNDGATTSPSVTFADRNTSMPTYLLGTCNGSLYMTYATTTPGVSWRMVRYDGVAAPVEIVTGDPAVVRPGFVCAGSSYYFFGRTSDTGREPWISDAAHDRGLGSVHR
jgi:ELWxxDGT repeat protein